MAESPARPARGDIEHNVTDGPGRSEVSSPHVPGSIADPILRRNIYHLYADIGGFGVLAGSAVAFLSIYLTRLGAGNSAIGWLTAGPALVNLLIALPMGQWIARRPLPPLVFWTSLGQRVLYLLLAPMPLLLPAPVQIPIVLLLVMLTAIPGAALTIGFNALFAEAVPAEWRGEVVGRRNAIVALTMMISTLVCGQILRLLPADQGYALVFGIGALGAAYSSYHLWHIHLAVPIPTRQWRGDPLDDGGQSGRLLTPDAPLRRTYPIRMLTRVRLGDVRAMVAPLHTAYGPFLFSLFAFHFAQYIPIALFPIFWVREAKLDDAAISLINATFYVVMFVSSLRLGSLTRRFGNYRLMVAGAILLSSYPLLTGLSQGLPMLLVAAVIGGAVWAILGGALSNRLLERIPADDRPPYLALYNLALNGAMLTGSIVGASLSGAIGLREALFVAVGLRLLAGVLLWRLG